MDSRLSNGCGHVFDRVVDRGLRRPVRTVRLQSRVYSRYQCRVGSFQAKDKWHLIEWKCQRPKDGFIHEEWSIRSCQPITTISVRYYSPLLGVQACKGEIQGNSISFNGSTSLQLCFYSCICVLSATLPKLQGETSGRLTPWIINQDTTYSRNNCLSGLWSEVNSSDTVITVKSSEEIPIANEDGRPSPYRLHFLLPNRLITIQWPTRYSLYSGFDSHFKSYFIHTPIQTLLKLPLTPPATCNPPFIHSRQ